MAIASAVLTAFAVQDDGSYQSSEAHAHLFEDWHPQLKGAKLKTADTFVLDTDRREGRAHITCKPRHGATVQPNKQRQRRALNDIKQLNDAGIAALRREHRGGTGLLSKTCIVWRVVRRCTGTTLCDASSTARRGCHCAVTVEYSATVEDVHKQRVCIKLAGIQAATAASLHSVSKQWDPAQLQAQHVAQFPIHCERVKRAAENIHGLQTQLVGSEQRLATEDDDSEYNDYNDADCTVADWRAETQAANPNCAHPLRRVDLDRRGSFVMQRACRAFNRRPVWWKDHRSESELYLDTPSTVLRYAYRHSSSEMGCTRLVRP